MTLGELCILALVLAGMATAVTAMVLHVERDALEWWR